MSISKEERVRLLAGLVGITVSEDEVSEVANRFDSLVKELERLNDLDLRDIQPVMVFPDEEA